MDGRRGGKAGKAQSVSGIGEGSELSGPLRAAGRIYLREGRKRCVSNRKRWEKENEENEGMDREECDKREKKGD